MPAPSSSPIDPAIGHLAGLAEGADGSLGVLVMLAGVADPRHRRGVRHRLAVILGLAVSVGAAGWGAGGGGVGAGGGGGGGEAGGAGGDVIAAGAFYSRVNQIK